MEGISTKKPPQRPAPFQRQSSARNMIIDRDYFRRLRDLPNTLPDGLDWLDYRTELCPTITAFYHTHFLHGTGEAPTQLLDFVTRRLGSNPPNLILMIVDTKSQIERDVTTEDGREARLIGIMICESYDVMIDGMRAQAIAIGGLTIAPEWRSMGLVLSMMKKGAQRVSLGEYMYVFNLKKERRIFPCAEIGVWWHPLKPGTTSLKMTIFKMVPPPPGEKIAEMVSRDLDTTSLHCRVMRTEDSGRVSEMLRRSGERFPLARLWTAEHVVRWFLPEDGVQCSYIVTDKHGLDMLDFFSFHVISYCVPKREKADETKTDDVKKEEDGGSVNDNGSGFHGDDNNETITIKCAVPSYFTSQHTDREAMVKFMMKTARDMGCDFVHGYGAMGYDAVFAELGFLKNENEVHFLQMLNWETRTFKGDEVGLAWIQF